MREEDANVSQISYLLPTQETHQNRSSTLEHCRSAEIV